MQTDAARVSTCLIVAGFALFLHARAIAAEATTVTEDMRTEEIAARLMAGSLRSNVTATVESEWGNEDLSCTPLDTRGIFYDEGKEVVRRPRLQMQIMFGFGSADIDERSYALLENIAAALNDPNIEEDRFILVGHTDAVGSDSYNKELSRRRAISVGDFLKERGVDPARLQLVGCGEAFLLDRNDPAAEVNRRVEIVNAGRQD